MLRDHAQATMGKQEADHEMFKITDFLSKIAHEELDPQLRRWFESVVKPKRESADSAPREDNPSGDTASAS